MARLCINVAVLATVAVAGSGCTGQNVEGGWHGRFPIEGAEDCRMRLYSGSRFDLTCRNDPVWVGGGTYHRQGEQLRFEFALLTRRGEVVKDAPPVEVGFKGFGNRMVLKTEEGAAYEWNRLKL